MQLKSKRVLVFHRCVLLKLLIRIATSSSRRLCLISENWTFASSIFIRVLLYFVGWIIPIALQIIQRARLLHLLLLLHVVYNRTRVFIRWPVYSFFFALLFECCFQRSAHSCYKGVVQLYPPVPRSQYRVDVHTCIPPPTPAGASKNKTFRPK